MMNTIVRNAVISALLSVPLSLGGCLAVAAGAAAGVGTYAYVTGKLTATLDAGLGRSYDATLAAVKQLGFSEKTKAQDAFEARVVSDMADGTEVNINLKKLTDSTTEVTIRVGVFGDEKKSVTILEEIKKHL